MSIAATVVQKLTTPPPGDPFVDESRITRPEPVGSPLYNRILGFLYHEAWLLDHDLFGEWLEQLATDLHYVAPVRVTRSRSQNNRGIVDRTGYHYSDTYETMAVRVRRILDTGSAWSDDPPLRTRRTISNVMVGATDVPGEHQVRSYLQVARNRFEWADYQWVTAERNDIIRNDGDGFKLARRSIVVDLSILGTPNLAMFL